FKLPDATAGVWTLRVEMLGFETLTRDVTVTAEPQPSEWTLKLRAFDDITAGIPRQASAPAQAPSATNGSAQRSTAAPAAPGRGGFQRAGVTTTPPPATRAAVPDEPPPAEAAQGAADGFLINGSVNNGAASPFAQAAA